MLLHISGRNFALIRVGELEIEPDKRAIAVQNSATIRSSAKLSPIAFDGSEKREFPRNA